VTPAPVTPEAELLRVEREIFARAPEHDIVPSLDRIRAVADLLGQPQRAFPVVHLTGTNGKTSTTRMVESLLRGFGLRTGRFTSPHLHSVRERIAFDGEPIPAERFVETYADVLPYLDMVDARAGHGSRSSRCSSPWGTPRSPTRRSTSQPSRSGSAAPGTRPTSPTVRSPS
jgi:dihydrofolate synthase/folylpolyglutamate synthase